MIYESASEYGYSARMAGAGKTIMEDHHRKSKYGGFCIYHENVIILNISSKKWPVKEMTQEDLIRVISQLRALPKLKVICISTILGQPLVERLLDNNHVVPGHYQIQPDGVNFHHCIDLVWMFHPGYVKRISTQEKSQLYGVIHQKLSEVIVKRELNIKCSPDKDCRNMTDFYDIAEKRFGFLKDPNINDTDLFRDWEPKQRTQPKSSTLKKQGPAEIPKYTDDQRLIWRQILDSINAHKDHTQDPNPGTNEQQTENETETKSPIHTPSSEEEIQELTEDIDKCHIDKKGRVWRKKRQQ